MLVDEEILIGCRPSVVWELIGDPSRYASLIDGVTRWEPTRQARTTGVGARYAVRMRVGAADVGGEVEVVEYQPPGDLAWTALRGIEQRGRWRLREVEPGVTRVTLRLAYHSPGGLTGLIADRISSRQVRAHVRRTLADLRRRLEEEEVAAPGRTAGAGAAGFVAQQLRAAAVFAGAGLLAPARPDRLVAAALGVHRWGLTLGGGYAAAAALHPDRIAIVDEHGELTFAEVDARTSALAAALAGAGIREGDRVGVLCRNHRGIIEASVAIGKLGADVLFLNTGFARPQIEAVIRGEEAAALVHDEEFTSLVSGTLPASRRFTAWEETARTSRRSLEHLIGRGGDEPPAPSRTGRLTILTSGTTGAPKGASRAQPRTADPAVALLSRLPLRAGEPTLVASPIFHSWGLSHLGLGVVLSSTLVLQRRFDAEASLAAIERHRITAFAAVPVMLQRILELPAATRRRYDTSSLAVVAVSGSALPGDLASRFMDEFGDILYNLYGSTEVAWATIAGPDDLREAPGTAGRPPFGTTVRLLDSRGREVQDGRTGRIFVANDMLFEGYTGGGGKDVVDGMMATGDLGHFDGEGRLFVEGREDGMIVSGGENIFPEEIEHVLLEHRDVLDVAVAGVPDERWGQRLHAFVVRRPRSSLTADGVRDQVRSRLAAYKVPRDVSFVRALPRNATGKVVRGDLAATEASDASPPGRRSRRTTGRTAPGTRTAGRRGARRRSSVPRGG